MRDQNHLGGPSSIHLTKSGRRFGLYCRGGCHPFSLLYFHSVCSNYETIITLKMSYLTQNCVENVKFDILSPVNVVNLEPETVETVKFDTNFS